MNWIDRIVRVLGCRVWVDRRLGYAVQSSLRERYKMRPREWGGGGEDYRTV